MDKKRLNFLYFLPILILLLCVNAYFDPASIITLKPQEETWANEVINGKAIAIEGKRDYDFNMRKFKQKLIEQMPKETDVIILGPSLITEIRKNDLEVNHLYNLGTNNNDIYDLLAQLALIEINNVKAKKMIFCISSTLFDEKIYKYSKLHKPFKYYSNYMINILNNKPNKNNQTKKGDIIAQIGQCIEGLFSVTYFQTSLKYAVLKKNVAKTHYIDESKYAVLKEFSGPKFLSDGSYIYSEEKQANKINDVQQIINERYKNGKVPWHTPKAHISDFSKVTFEKIVQYYLTKGVKVEIFLCPFPPSAWNMINKQKYPIINEEEEFAKELANKYNIRIIGSLNPNNVGVSDEDFYDHSHMRHNSLVKFFNFND